MRGRRFANSKSSSSEKAGYPVHGKGCRAIRGRFANPRCPCADAAGRERDIVAALGRLDTIWSELFPAEQQRILHLLIERIVIKPSGFAITLRAEGMRSLAEELKPAGLGVAA